MASIIIIAVVLVLDVLAFVLAIGAERRRSYVRDHQHSALLIPSLSSQPISLFFFGFHSFRDSMDRARTHERAGLRERGLETRKTMLPKEGRRCSFSIAMSAPQEQISEQTLPFHYLQSPRLHLTVCQRMTLP